MRKDYSFYFCKWLQNDSWYLLFCHLFNAYFCSVSMATDNIIFKKTDRMTQTFIPVRDNLPVVVLDHDDLFNF